MSARRWYLEDFLQYPLDPAPTIARRIEARLKAIGEDLFSKVFLSDRDATRLWDKMFDELNNTRVDIITEVQEATSIPWELLRDPTIDVPLALRAQSFVRAQPNPAQRPFLPSPVETGAIRILLVICPPGDAPMCPSVPSPAASSRA